MNKGSKIYSAEYFDYVDLKSSNSARIVVPLLMSWMSCRSVADFGCGRGVWLSEWAAAGVADIRGIDGPYVNQERLYIPRADFLAHDLTSPLDLGRRFDLVQSLEVAEHLPPYAASAFVELLVKHAPLVVFSAAVPGQGGESHLNERPLHYWQGLFRQHNYFALDCIRPHIRTIREIEPWYRFNMILYGAESAIAALPSTVQAFRIPEGARLRSAGDALWYARRAGLSLLPRPAVSALARAHSRILASSARGRRG
ncbi:MAG TPA: hypothetical protein DDY14_08360 [Chromatiaceae bacterium]|jgi:SAM-dependent methyltransferase|nr:class I SAM-dependent methyltransferase [Paracoccaceae bacterium]HBG95320.1 hypothetical protein [Chromatiaceae bacterium]